MRQGQGKDITVNINDWLNRRTQQNNDEWRELSGVVPSSMTADELVAEADRRQLAWQEAERERVLAGKLEKESINCGECSQDERPYIADYLCYKCRDKLDS